MTRALLSHHSVPDKTGVYNEPEGAVALSDVSTRSDVSLIPRKSIRKRLANVLRSCLVFPSPMG